MKIDVAQLGEPQPLDPETFRPYGEVLRRQDGGEAFQDLHTESQSAGWRVALLDIYAGPLHRLHRHPDSEECFAPMHGEPCIVVAEANSPAHTRLFRLDEPVCIARNTWHEIVTRSGSCRVFIAENAEIGGEELFLDPVVPWG